MVEKGRFYLLKIYASFNWILAGTWQFFLHRLTIPQQKLWGGDSKILPPNFEYGFEQTSWVFITEEIQTTHHKLLPLVSLPTQESWCSASFILFLLIQRKKHFRLLSNCPLNYLPSAPFTLTVSHSDLFLFGFKYSQVSEILKKTSVAHCNTIFLLNFHSLSDISDVPQAASSPTARSRPDFWVWLGSQKLVP